MPRLLLSAQQSRRLKVPRIITILSSRISNSLYSVSFLISAQLKAYATQLALWNTRASGINKSGSSRHGTVKSDPPRIGNKDSRPAIGKIDSSSVNDSKNTSKTVHVLNTLNTRLTNPLQSARNALNTLNSRLSTPIVSAQTTFNTLTGYASVEQKKLSVLAKDLDVKRSKELAQKAKVAYEECIEERRRCQKDLNALLQVSISG